MRPLLPRFLPPALQIFALVCGLAMAVPVHAQEASPQVNQAAAALELLFQLGLPETKAAKWVVAEGSIDSQELFGDEDGGSRGEGSGNAWVLGEQKGEADLLTVNGMRVRVAVMKDDEPPDVETNLPMVRIKPADWAKDAGTFLARLKKVSAKYKNGPGERDYQFAGIQTQCGPALLYLAQAQRRGDTAMVREALPLVLALGGGPDTTLDRAISTLADQRLQSLAADWVRGRDAAAYAAALDALVAQFSRGWNKQAAARELARRLRTPEVSPTLSAEAKEAAIWLLSWSAEELETLPPREAWLLPEVAEEDGEERGFSRRSMRRYSRGGMISPSGESKIPDRAAKFFEKPRDAARALAELLEDQRMLGMLKEVEGGSSYRFPGDEEEHESLERTYEQIARPQELGEFCHMLLAEVLPAKLQSAIEDGGKAKAAVLGWLDRLGKMTDDELAWEYLRGSSNVSDAQFRSAMAYLLEKGSDESRAQLDAVFLDQAVWARGSDELLLALAKHVERRSGDREVFREKLFATVKAGREASRLEQMRYSPDASYAKHIEKQEAAFLKKLEQTFKPVDLRELLEQMANGDDEEVMVTLQTLGPVVTKTEATEAEGLLLQAAAKVKSLPAKSGLLGLAAQRIAKDADKPAAMAAPPSEVARKAAAQLLQDETLLPANQWGGDDQSVADATTATLLWPRWSAVEREGLEQLSGTAGSLVRSWMRSRAHALIAGSPPPPLPDAKRVPQEETGRLLAELASLKPTECLAALRSKSLDQQLAVMTHLRDPKTEWPASIRAAHFTIGAVSATPEEIFPAEPWKGRILEEAAIRELGEAVEKSAVAGKALIVRVEIRAILDGVRIRAFENKRPISAPQLASFDLKMPPSSPPPDAVLSMQVSSKTQLWTLTPLWKDAAATKAWREAQEKKPADADRADVSPRGKPADPAVVASAIQKILEGGPEDRGVPATIVWNAARVAEAADDPEMSEPAEEDEED